ncbi:MAG: SDR family NAD(P)-dependent oxidoreductase [Alphaproteobacteria bacterium]|nr:SDR family NAD(P)-dependent oxidoreductase [Alphaproteobacteria bacterium]
MKKHLFCFGHGYSCDYISHELLKRNDWKVSGTTRDRERQQELRMRGVQTHIFDQENPLADPLYILRDVTHILVSTPPSGDGDVTFNLHAQDFTKLPNLQWVGYLSTTSPYGNREGEWVDETSKPQPTTRRGVRRLEAENDWLSLYDSYRLPVHIFRLAGIYGPGRSGLDSVRSGVARRIDKPGHAFSRIHVEDLAQTLIVSMEKPTPGEVFNVCDDQPVPSHEVIDYACKLLHKQSPQLIPYDQADLAPITESFYKDNKRVRNDKIKNVLGIQLRYPNYKKGLEACLEAENYAFSVLGIEKREA